MAYFRYKGSGDVYDSAGRYISASEAAKIPNFFSQVKDLNYAKGTSTPAPANPFANINLQAGAGVGANPYPSMNPAPKSYSAAGTGTPLNMAGAGTTGGMVITPDLTKNFQKMYGGQKLNVDPTLGGTLSYQNGMLGVTNPSYFGPGGGAGGTNQRGTGPTSFQAFNGFMGPANPFSNPTTVSPNPLDIPQWGPTMTPDPTTGASGTGAGVGADIGGGTGGGTAGGGSTSGGTSGGGTSGGGYSATGAGNGGIDLSTGAGASGASVGSDMGYGKYNVNTNPTNTVGSDVFNNPTTLADLQKKITDNNSLYAQRLTNIDSQITNAASMLQPTAEEKALQAKLFNQQGGLEAGTNKILNQPIPLDLLRGQAAALQRQGNADIATTQRSLALEQQSRQQNFDQLKFEIDQGRASADSLLQLSQLYDQQANNFVNRANTLADNARQSLNMILDSFKGLTFDKLTPDSIAQLATFAQQAGIPLDVLKEGMQVAKNQLDLTNTIAQQKASGSTTNPANVNQDALQGLLNIYHATGTVPPLGQANTGLRTAFYAALGSDGQGFVNQSQANKAMLAGAKTALTTQQNQYSANQTAINTLDQQLGLAKQYSDKVGRADSPFVNNYLLSLKSGVFGDPDTAAFHNIVKTASNEFAKILSGAAASVAGVTVSSASDAENLLNTAMSKGQFNAVIDLMKKEAQYRLDNQKQTISSIQSDISGGFNSTDTPTTSNGQFDFSAFNW